MYLDQYQTASRILACLLLILVVCNVQDISVRILLSRLVLLFVLHLRIDPELVFLHQYHVLH